MKSKLVQRLLRLLIALSGAGVGVALSMGLLRLHAWTRPGQALPVAWVVGLYLGTAMLGGLVCLLFSGGILAWFGEWASTLENRLDKMTMAQLLASVLGLIGGLLIAALASQVIWFMGESIFTTAFSAILFVFLGAVGLSIGKRRSEDMAQLLGRIPGWRERRGGRKGAAAARPKLLDTSAIIDGRILGVCRTGFVEGELVVPSFVLDELRHIADSPDGNRRNRGRHGLDILKKLQDDPAVTVRIEAVEDGAADEADVRLLRMAQQMGAAIVTGDYNLNKVANVTGVDVLNLNELVGALRPVVLPGEEMNVTILREGREPGQGVGYLDDGTMIVVEGGQYHQGESVATVVTSALQTSAGRMIFTKIKA